VGNISFYDPAQDNSFTKPFSEETGKMIDEEVREMIDVAYKRTLALLTDKKEQVEKLAKALLEKEVLHKSDVEELIGHRPFEEKKETPEVVPATTDDAVENANATITAADAADNVE
jgi:cell division protease FtsH